MVLEFMLSHWKGLLAALAILALAVHSYITARALADAKAMATAAAQKLQTAAAQLQGYQAVTPVAPAKVEAALSPAARSELARIRKAVEDTKVELHALSTAKIESTSTGTLIPATPTTPQMCEETFHRFRVNMSDCSFAISQSFKWEAQLLRGVDGKTRLFKATMTEFDPVTGQPIPGPPPQVVSEIQIADEQGPAPKLFGLKVLGGVDERWAPGGGLQFAEKWRLSLRALGFFSPKDSDLRGLLGVGWRPKVAFFDSALSFGAGVGRSTKKPGWIFGAHATVPLGTITK